MTNRRRALTVVFAALATSIAINVFACARLKERIFFTALLWDYEGALSTKSVFWLSESQLKMLKTKSDNGDGSAALRLYEYYSGNVGNRELSHSWLRRAVELGNREAISISNEIAEFND